MPCFFLQSGLLTTKLILVNFPKANCLVDWSKTPRNGNTTIINYQNYGEIININHHQTWQWTVPHLWLIFPARNLHLKGISNCHVWLLEAIYHDLSLTASNRPTLSTLGKIDWAMKLALIHHAIKSSVPSTSPIDDIAMNNRKWYEPSPSFVFSWNHRYNPHMLGETTICVEQFLCAP